MQKTSAQSQRESKKNKSATCVAENHATKRIAIKLKTLTNLVKTTLVKGFKILWRFDVRL